MTETFTCQYCGEVLPSANTFHDLTSCYVHLKRRIAHLESENAILKAVANKCYEWHAEYPFGNDRFEKFTSDNLYQELRGLLEPPEVTE